MAQVITRLLPNRNFDPKSEVNMFALDAASGEAGTFVKVSAANLSDDPVAYVNRPDAFANSLGNATSQYPEVTRKVTAAGTGDGGVVIGMITRDVREIDENGESLHFYPQKKEELQCVVSGEANPIVSRGTVEVNVRGLAGGVAPNVGDLAVLAANGQITGVSAASASAQQKADTVGTILGTGLRVSQQSTDSLAGPYAMLKFSV